MLETAMIVGLVALVVGLLYLFVAFMALTTRRSDERFSPSSMMEEKANAIIDQWGPETETFELEARLLPVGNSFTGWKDFLLFRLNDEADTFKSTDFPYVLDGRRLKPKAHQVSPFDIIPTAKLTDIFKVSSKRLRELMSHHDKHGVALSKIEVRARGTLIGRDTAISISGTSHLDNIPGEIKVADLFLRSDERHKEKLIRILEDQCLDLDFDP